MQSCCLADMHVFLCPKLGTAERIYYFKKEQDHNNEYRTDFGIG